MEERIRALNRRLTGAVDARTDWERGRTGLREGKFYEFAKSARAARAQRESDWDEEHPGAHLAEGVRTDWYEEHSGRSTVSIEDAAAREFRLKDAIDDARDEETEYSSSPGRVGDGDAPCRVARRRWTG